MALINARELLAFPAGDNSSDTFIGGIHWNLTTLRRWNYAYYSNETFSNGSLCFLISEPYTPHLLQNGTFLNSTSCYSPVEPLKTRSKVGLFFAAFFGMSIMFTFINLRKHGKLFLPTEKRFTPVGRRWQWYWMLAVAAFAMISGITGIDVDRYYLPELPIVLSNFFWFLMLPTTMCVVWESVRHWGSWQERQMVDPNPFLLKQDDRRSKVEFYLPLIFYLFAWMNFFMVVPRPWGAVELQRDSNQAQLRAAPLATDTRFKVGAFFLFGSWIVTIYSLQHSIHYYKPRNRGLLNRAFGLLRYVPLKFLFTMPLSLVMIGYAVVTSFNFDISPLNLKVDLGYMYGLGWGPIVGILLVYEIAGYINPNEDRELIRQRRIRGAEADQEMGITKKPHWWSRLHGNNTDISVRDQIARNVNEIGGGQVTTKNLEATLEMGNMPVSKGRKPPGEIEAVRVAAGLLFPINRNLETQERFTDRPELERENNTSRTGTISRSEGGKGSDHTTTNATNLGAETQVVRSMLDV